jgi:hypothetical protein
MLFRSARFFADPAAMVSDGGEGENDGLNVSVSARDPIRLAPRSGERDTSPLSYAHAHGKEEIPDPDCEPHPDWLSRPVSGRTLAWLVDGLVVTAGFLVFAVIFLSITQELPQWPVTASVATAVFVAAAYWAFFSAFGGGMLGVRLARVASATNSDTVQGRSQPRLKEIDKTESAV